MNSRRTESSAHHGTISQGHGRNRASITLKRCFHIHIGGLHASRRPTVVQTTVGSCVAVCLYDPGERVGGMNHILLPGRADLKHFDSAARYGINAMELLINKIMRLGGKRDQLIAKVFGGGHILPSISKENGVGRKNTEFIMEFLQAEAIRVIAHDLGGHESRRIYFHTDTGDVFLKRIFSKYQPNIALEEKRVMRKIRKEAEKPTNVTLF